MGKGMAVEMRAGLTNAEIRNDQQIGTQIANALDSGTRLPNDQHPRQRGEERETRPRDEQVYKPPRDDQVYQPLRARPQAAVSNTLWPRDVHRVPSGCVRGCRTVQWPEVERSTHPTNTTRTYEKVPAGCLGTRVHVPVLGTCYDWL